MGLLKINTGAALDNAAQIDSIVNSIKDSMETLDAAIKRNIPDQIQTEWSDNVRNNWDKYYTGDVPEAMEEMTQSAINLKTAVDEAIAFSQER